MQQGFSFQQALIIASTSRRCFCMHRRMSEVGVLRGCVLACEDSVALHLNVKAI
jgi:hypothetical protein